ncbi:hypothetical protein DMA11_14695 [Marinilabiliaceae bacterium JC017]|nr:hypothetical protein DMA11_14695 [Marinilabiliaceae bacterium JC017]
MDVPKIIIRSFLSGRGNFFDLKMVINLCVVTKKLKNMIKALLVHLLSKEEFYTLVKRLINAIIASNLDDILKSMLLERLQPAFDKYEATLNRRTGNPLSKEVEEKDQVRDFRFLGFRMMVEAFCYHWEPPLQEAARVLREIIRRHGWCMYHEGNKKETALINAMINEMHQEPAAAHLEMLDLTEWLVKLNDAQTDFETTLQAREIKDSEESVDLLTIRKSLYENVRATLSYIESQMNFYESDNLKQLINAINEIITGVTSSAKARRTRQKETENE